MIDPLGYIPIQDNLQAIAFYNVENLFDLVDDKYTNDNAFLNSSVKNWTPKRYENKRNKLAFAISNIGKQETGKHPAIVGLAEIENAKVIEDLITSTHLDGCNYGYIHYDSLDERGIDVALLYDTTAFKISTTETFRVHLTKENGETDYTRDILLVSGYLDGELIHVIANHWSSRREGPNETEHKRLAAANKVIEIIQGIRKEFPNPKIIVVGDFNDDPSSTSIQHLVDSERLFNPMSILHTYSRGTSTYKYKWNLFDQILFSTNFFESTPDTLSFNKAEIFDADFLKLSKGKYKGKPFRTFIGPKYKGGYSDHFPVYAIFKK